MPKWSSNLNHLTYVDDTIIFSSTNAYSLEKIMSTLQKYEKQSGQKVNKDKNLYYIHQNIIGKTDTQIAQIIGMDRAKFLMKYLGCPITHKKKRTGDYAELLDKVKGNFKHGRVKCYLMGKEVLITRVLQSILVYILSGIIPPICVLKDFQRIFAKFFWSNKESGRSKH